MKVLITGGTGFIGSHLAELLLTKKYSVRCLIRKTSDLKWLHGLNVELVYGDLFDTEALRKAVADVDVVYHSAGVTKAKTEEEYFRGNATGTVNLLDAVQKHNPHLTRFLHISTQAAVGPSPTKAPIDETVEARPLTSYGRTKLEAERECLRRMSTLPITICRPPVVYGPRDKDVFEFFNTLNKGLQPMVGFHEKYVSMIHVLDLIRGFVMAAESDKSIGQTYFISSKGVYDWKTIGTVANEVMKKKVLRVRIPESGVYVIAAFAEFFSLFSSKAALINFEKAREMVQDYWTCDASKAKRDFGFEQKIEIEQGFRETIEWYRSQRLL
jgi:dihydroflavonol-4-reductase